MISFDARTTGNHQERSSTAHSHDADWLCSRRASSRTLGDNMGEAGKWHARRARFRPLEATRVWSWRCRGARERRLDVPSSATGADGRSRDEGARFTSVNHIGLGVKLCNQPKIDPTYSKTDINPTDSTSPRWSGVGVRVSAPVRRGAAPYGDRSRRSQTRSHLISLLP